MAKVAFRHRRWIVTFRGANSKMNQRYPSRILCVGVPEYHRLIIALSDEKAGNIAHDDTIVLIGLLEKLYTYLCNIKKFKEEGIKDMLAEKLILETDRLIYEF